MNAVILQQSSPLLLSVKQINEVHSYDEEDGLFQKYENNGPWVRGSGDRAGF